MSRIKELSAKIIKDSLGQPTIEVYLKLSEGSIVTASVPGGESVGEYEAKNVSPVQSLEIINTLIRPALINLQFKEIKQLDDRLFNLDGTSDKSKIGANSMIAISIAGLRALAKSNNLADWAYISQISKISPSISTPMMVIIEGGKHSYYQNITWQEFLVIGEIWDGKKVYQTLLAIIKKANLKYMTGLEGGLCIDSIDNEQAKKIFIKSVNQINRRMKISFDIAASHLKSDISDISNLMKLSNLFSIEDPAGQNDWENWQKLMHKYGSSKVIVGDDLICTNPERLKIAIFKKACNGVIIKPNQIGTISETLQVAKLANDANFVKIVSHRSHETMDDFIADLAVGIGAEFLKSGAPTKVERLVKYKRLELIKKEING